MAGKYREILVINPSKRRRKRRKTTTKKRRTVRAATKPRKRRTTTMARKRRRTTKRRIVRRNPARRRAVRRTARRASNRLFSGLSFKKVISNMPATQLGMFAAKWAAKRGNPDATETDPGSWNYMSYIKGAVGAVGAALLCNFMKQGAAQKALEGGLNLMMFKLIENEAIANNAWATAQFGTDYEPTEYLLTGENDWFMGYDGNYYPSNEANRLPEAEYGYGDALEEVGPLGEALTPVGPLGASDPYANAWFKNV